MKEYNFFKQQGAVRNHPELFQFKCPECSKTMFPYRTVGSPLSGRVDLEGRCASGWHGIETVSGESSGQNRWKT